MSLQTWDLDVFFSGGSDSEALRDFLALLERDLQSLRSRLRELGPIAQEGKDVDSFADSVVQATLSVQEIAGRHREAAAFVSCLQAQDVADHNASVIAGRVAGNGAELTAALTELERLFLDLSDDSWTALLRDSRLADIAFSLTERRRRAADKLPLAQELLVTALSVDGYQAWGRLYNAIVGRMKIAHEMGGQTKWLSVGQAANELNGPNRQLRVSLFSKWEETWADNEELFAETINHLAGFRLQVYKQRGWDSVLREPLEINRMQPDTLDAMWLAVSETKPLLTEALRRKARLLGLSELSWHDVSAPAGESTAPISYAEAREFVVEQFGKFNPDMADFAERCFRERWIESEDRPGKRPGGFCTSFPVRGQSRVFMTFSGKLSNVATLAHELGHAYHQHVMQGLPYFAKNYAMNVAETASTFAEAVVADAALRAAGHSAERITLLEDKVQRAVAFFMNIHARFIFELAFYDRRKDGLLSPAALNELMTNAQEQAFAGALSDYHPRFWASKLHFYSTGTPFYNFPYTFGFLFSTGVYARAEAEGPKFAGRYIDLLRDTGRMRVEDLAYKHLGVNLTQPDFWRESAERVLADVRAFLRETD